MTVGSASNVGEFGMDEERRRACILEIDPDGRNERLYASGLRNPVGLDFEPETGAMWTAVNERDELGDELVPDYITSVREGGFYGWPYAYFGRNEDPRRRASARTWWPIAHPRPRRRLAHRVAGLGLLHRHRLSGTLPRRRLHRPARLLEPRRALRLQGRVRPVRPGPAQRPDGGFPHRLRRRRRPGPVHGRPCGVVMLPDGSLLVADDAGNRIWRWRRRNPASATQTAAARG